MKINESTNSNTNVSNIASNEAKKTLEGRETSFQGQLRKVDARSYEERLNELVKQILEQGEKLGRKTDIKELRAYKKLISQFMDEAVNGSHKFSKQNLLDRRGRHKVYALIKKINGEVDQLTKDVLSEEKDNIRILQRLDDIRGMILDLTM